MGLWSFLSGKTIKTGDAFFGGMRFFEVAARPANSYFECQHYFAPSGELIELHITATRSGPTAQQKAFFTWVEQEYAALAAKLVPLLEQELGAWMPQPVIRDFYAEFKPTFLDVPACDQRPVEWEIVFDTVHDANHTVTVGMLGSKPQYVRVDG